MKSNNIIEVQMKQIKSLKSFNLKFGNLRQELSLKEINNKLSKEEKSTLSILNKKLNFFLNKPNNNQNTLNQFIKKYDKP